MRVLGLVPARGGSKGVPRKNVRLLCGKPLIAYTAEAARNASRLSRIVLTTDDEEIADIGRQHGLETPFMRPPDLARDDTPTLPVMRHAIETLEAMGDLYDAICLLQPTNPLRVAKDIDACIALLENPDVSAVISVLPVPLEYNPHWVYFQDKAGVLHLSTGEAQPIPRRQLLPRAYHRDGSLYVMRRDVLMIENSLYGSRLVGYPISSERVVNIDTMDDFARAERLICGEG